MTKETPNEETDTSNIAPLEDAFFAAARRVDAQQEDCSLGLEDDLRALKIQATEPPSEEED